MTSTKKSLLASGLSILICVALLLGTTFAWFTDSVTNSGNEIQAGTLKIGLDTGDAETLFTSDENFLWEPGRSQKATATVSNEGSLWLKYTMSFENVKTTGDADITNVLDVYLVDSNADSLDNAQRLGTVAELMTAGSFGAKDAVLAPKGYTGTDGTSTQSFTVVIKMQEGAGNAYQGTGVTFDITVVAAQYTKETDGFGSDQYDNQANYPVRASVGDNDSLMDALDHTDVPVEINLTNSLSNVTKFNVTGDVTLNMDKNTLKSSSSIVGATLKVTEGGSLTINAVANDDGFDYTAGGLSANGDGSQITVNGGRYGVSGAFGAEVSATDGGVVTVNSGIFTSSGYQGHAVMATNGATIYVNGGRFGSSGAQSTVIFADGGTIVVESCEFSGVNGKRYSVANDGQILISKTFSSQKPTSVASGCSVSDNGNGYWVITAD